MANLLDEESGKGKRKRTREDALKHAFGAGSSAVKSAQDRMKSNLTKEEDAELQRDIEQERSIQRGLGASIRRGPASVKSDSESGNVQTDIPTEAQYQAQVETGVNLANSRTEETSQLAAKKLDEAGADDASKRKIITNIDRGQLEKGFSQGPLTAKFTEGIAAWLPAIVGASFGGSKGLQAGLAATKQLRDERDKSKTGFKTKFQQTEFVDEKNRPIVYDAATDQHYTVDGKVAEKFFDPKQKRFEANMKFKEKKEAQLTQEQVKAISQNSKILSSLDRIERLKRSVQTGPADAPIQSFLELAGVAPKEFSALKTEVHSNLALFVKSISGAQVAEPEFKRLGNVVPQMDDQDEVFDVKLKTFRRIIKDNQSAILEAIKTGQPMKAETSAKIKAQLDAAEEKINSLELSSGKFKRVRGKKGTKYEGKVARWSLDGKRFLGFEDEGNK